MDNMLVNRRIRLGAWSVLGLLSAAGSATFLPAPPVWDSTYLALAAALLVGSLLSLPWPGGTPPTSLLIIPLIVMHWRVGAATAPALLVATAVAHRARGAGWTASISAAGQDVIAFGLAYLAGEAFSPQDWTSAVFVGVFAGLQSLLRWGAVRYSLPPANDPRPDRPDLLLVLVQAPLGAIPLLAGRLLGDGGLLLALAALLLILCVVREWWKLSVLRVEAEAELGRLERARLLQEELTDLITHEIRNPLTIVQGNCQLARDSLRLDPTDPWGVDKVDQHLDRIAQAGKSIDRLMDNLLEIGRVEQMADPPASEAVDLGVLAREVSAELEPLAEQKRLSIVLDLPEQAPLAQGSPLLLQEVLSNLVSNAIKYTPQRGRVSIWVRRGPEPGSVTLGVTDTGVGLSESDQGRLFSKFFRSSDPRVTRERGAGLGLALTQSIVERMGGRISVESRLNEGATFRVLLPAASEGS